MTVTTSKYLQLLLEANHYRVLTSRNSEQAIEQVLQLQKQGRQPDLILTDIQMPGLTGLELIDGLRAAGTKSPILVMTGYGNREMTLRLRDRCCEDFLNKPFEEEELPARVKELLAKADAENQSEDTA
jgi:DNA-binding response OmpR family regulator